MLFAKYLAQVSNRFPRFSCVSSKLSIFPIAVIYSTYFLQVYPRRHHGPVLSFYVNPRNTHKCTCSLCQIHYTRFSKLNHCPWICPSVNYIYLIRHFVVKYRWVFLRCYVRPGEFLTGPLVFTNIAWYLYSLWALFVLYEVRLDNNICYFELPLYIWNYFSFTLRV